MPSRIIGPISWDASVLNKIAEWPLAWVKQRSYNIDYSWKPEGSRWIDFDATLWTTRGLILLAKEITSQEESHLGTMDIVVERNAYGRQLGSFYTEAECKGVGQIPMTFILYVHVQLYL